MRQYIIAIGLAVFSLSAAAQTNPNPDEPSGIFAPNAFTPNGDFTNDEFRVLVSSACDPVDFHLSVYDRYGRMVFESIETTKAWDGKYNGRMVKDGVYIWHLVANYLDPDGINATRLEDKGSVTLYR